jgi:3-oxoacyl-[acyl-carrier protein] reductase
MNLHLQGKTALVAASSKGLGKACAHSLAAEGVDLILCARDQKSLDSTKAEFTKEFPKIKVTTFAVDLNDPEQITGMFAALKKTKTGIDILVTNNGGPKPLKFADVTDADWEFAFNQNFMCSVRLIRNVLPMLQKQKWGRIINITSLSTKEPIPNLILSNAIRAAVHGMAKTLAADLIKDNITINNVLPGDFATNRILDIAKKISAEQKVPYDDLLKDFSAAPIGRMGRPQELGDFVAYLASENASYTTGQSFVIDGGLYKAVY